MSSASVVALKPVRASDKRIVNGGTDVNQLAPFKYTWAWDKFIKANANHWVPTEIGMGSDIFDFKQKLSDADKHLFTNVLSFLSTSDIMAMRNIGLAIMEKITAPEIQAYQARQIAEESVHTWTYQHCIEVLGLDQGEVYNRYRVIPEIHAKIAIAARRLESVLRPNIDLKDRDELQNFLMAYTFFAGVFEGTWFYNGFTPVFALQRRGLMKETAEQFQYILRDEVLHAEFGLQVVSEIMAEENIRLDPVAWRTMWEECHAAEEDYMNYVLPRPMVGYSASQHMEQFRYIANRRAREVGMPEVYPGAENVLTWLDEQAIIKKEKNFFETRVTEYQRGSALSWDDEEPGAGGTPSP